SAWLNHEAGVSRTGSVASHQQISEAPSVAVIGSASTPPHNTRARNCPMVSRRGRRDIFQRTRTAPARAEATLPAWASSISRNGHGSSKLLNNRSATAVPRISHGQSRIEVSRNAPSSTPAGNQKKDTESFQTEK